MHQRYLVVMDSLAIFGAASLMQAPDAPAAVPGARADSPDSGKCHRSKWSHPALPRKDGALDGTLTFVACSGATIRHIYKGTKPGAFTLTLAVKGNDDRLGFDAGPPVTAET